MGASIVMPSPERCEDLARQMEFHAEASERLAAEYRASAAEYRARAATWRARAEVAR